MQGHYTFTDQETGEVRSVGSEEEAGQMSDITSKVIGLPKYQKTIQELRRASKNSAVGIVNLITGRTGGHLVDAVLASAFPPGNGSVFRSGTGGYGIDCSTWGKPEDCAAKMSSLLKGSPEVLSMEDLSEMQTAVGTFGEGLSDAKAKASAQDASNQMKALLQAIGGVDAGGAPSQPSPSVGGLAGVFNQQAQQEDTMEQRLARRTQLKTALKHIRAKISALDPVSEASLRNQFTTMQRAAEIALADVESEMPKKYTDNGEAIYDQTGFMHFKAQAPSWLMKYLYTFSDPKKLAKKLNQDIDALAQKLVDNGTRKTATLTPVERKKIAQGMIDRVVNSVKAAKQGGSKKISKTCDNIIEIMEGGLQGIKQNHKGLQTAVSSLETQISSQQTVMVLQNVTDSSLVSYPEGRARAVTGDSQSIPQFSFRPLLRNEFVKKNVRQGKSIVFVTQDKVDFGVDGVISVELKGTVDQDEAGEIIDVELDSFLKEAGIEKNNVYILPTQARKLKALLAGAPHQQAISILKTAFGEALDMSGGKVIKGDVLMGIMRETVNNMAMMSVGSGGGGAENALKLKQPSIKKDQYIWTENTEWGDFIDQEILTTARKVEDQEQALLNRQKVLDKAIDKGDEAEITALSRRVDGLSDSIMKDLETIPHFLILHGEASSGKSAFAEYFADLMGLEFIDADIGQTKGQYVGMTEHNTRKMLEAWENLSDCVIRLDEIDGQIAGDEDAARNSHNASSVQQLLTFFNDKVSQLNDANVFFIATTNNPGLLRSQIFSRAQSKEVPLPLTTQGYEKWLETALDRVKRNYNRGFVMGEFTYRGKHESIWSDPESWEFCKKAWAENIDCHIVAEALANNPNDANVKIDFRNLSVHLRNIFGAFDAYLRSQEALRLYSEDQEEFAIWFPSYCKKDETGKIVEVTKPKLEGFDLTTENVVGAFNASALKSVGGYGTNIEARQTIITNGVSTYRRKMQNEREQEAVSDAASGQMDLFGPDMGVPQPQGIDEDLGDLLTEASSPVSTDYYFSKISEIVGMKSPIAPDAPRLQQERPVIEEAPIETNPSQNQPRKKRRGGYYMDGRFAMGPCEATVIL